MPPAMIPTLSAELSLNARRVTCHQPRAGICVGSSACSPGRRSPGPAARWRSSLARSRCAGARRCACRWCGGRASRGGRGRNGSARARRAADRSFRLRSAAMPTTAQASAFAPGTAACPRSVVGGAGRSAAGTSRDGTKDPPAGGRTTCSAFSAGSHRQPFSTRPATSTRPAPPARRHRPRVRTDVTPPLAPSHRPRGCAVPSRRAQPGRVYSGRPAGGEKRRRE